MRAENAVLNLNVNVKCEYMFGRLTYMQTKSAVMNLKVNLKCECMFETFESIVNRTLLFLYPE